jgi:hypothetical protein
MDVINMNWNAEPVKHLLEIVHIDARGRKFTDSQDYTPNKYSTTLSIHKMSDDVELIIKPYTIEHLNNIVTEEYPNGTITELFIGLRNDVNVEYMGLYWISKEFNGKNIKQYFLKDDKPSAFNYGFLSGPGWPINMHPMIDDRLSEYFEELKDIKSKATRSLDTCINLLSQPGPDYKSGDTSITMQLKKKVRS